MVRSEEINMENHEDILDALSTYEKKPTPDIPPLLESFLRQVAKTGETLFPWQRLKSLMINKLDQVINQFHQDFPADHLQTCPNVENTRFEEMRKRILTSVDEFQGAPFTIQRICELMTEPKKHYKRSDKFLRGIEKNVLVVSTVDPFGRKVVSESRNLVNGLDMNGYSGEQLDQRPLQFTSFPSPHQTSPAAECVRLNEFIDSHANNNSNGTIETNPTNENQPTINRFEVSEIGSQSEVKVEGDEESKSDTRSEVKVCESEVDDNKCESTDSPASDHRVDDSSSSLESTSGQHPTESCSQETQPLLDTSKAETDSVNVTEVKGDRLIQETNTVAVEESEQSQIPTNDDQNKEVSVEHVTTVCSPSGNSDPESAEESPVVHSSTEIQHSEMSSLSSETNSITESSPSVQSSESNTSSTPESNLPNIESERKDSSENVISNTEPCERENMEVDSSVCNMQPNDRVDEEDKTSCSNEGERTEDKVKVESESNSQSADVPMDED